MNLKANQVYQVLLEEFEGPASKDSPVALLFGVVFSMLIIAGIVLGAFCAMHLDISAGTLVGAIVAAWVLGYFLGKYFGQSQGYNDTVQRKVDSMSSWGASRESQGEAQGLGCLLAILQFAFGGLYTGLNALFSGSSSGSDKKLRLATAIVTLIYNQPRESFSLDKISGSLQAAGLPTPPKPLQSALQALVSRNLIHGTPDLGYSCNASQVERFL